MEDKEFLKVIIDECIKANNMNAYYILFVSLISSDNNITEEDIKENCRLIDKLIEVLSDYPDNIELQESRQKLIEYNKIYKTDVRTEEEI